MDLEESAEEEGWKAGLQTLAGYVLGDCVLLSRMKHPGSLTPCLLYLQPALAGPQHYAPREHVHERGIAW